MDWKMKTNGVNSIGIFLKIVTVALSSADFFLILSKNSF